MEKDIIITTIEGDVRMIISIASGKGGTGKTTIALSLSRILSQDRDVTLVDCDVEEPNVHNFINGDLEKIIDVNARIPVIDENRCDHCGKCSSTCNYNAIAILKDQVMVFPELCNGCTACSIICPRDAIGFEDRKLGQISRGISGHLRILEGRLDLGQAKAVPVIYRLKLEIGKGTTLIDCPPGSSCPVIESARGSDLILLVVEPTHFGFHDLKKVYHSLKSLGIPMMLLINKVGTGDVDIESFAEEEGIDVIGQLPFDLKLKEVYSRGRDMLEEVKWFKEIIQRIGDHITEIEGSGCDGTF